MRCHFWTNGMCIVFTAISKQIKRFYPWLSAQVSTSNLHYPVDSSLWIAFMFFRWIQNFASLCSFFVMTCKICKDWSINCRVFASLTKVYAITSIFQKGNISQPKFQWVGSDEYEVMVLSLQGGDYVCHSKQITSSNLWLSSASLSLNGLEVETNLLAVRGPHAFTKNDCKVMLEIERALLSST